MLWGTFFAKILEWGIRRSTQLPGLPTPIGIWFFVNNLRWHSSTLILKRKSLSTLMKRGLGWVTLEEESGVNINKTTPLHNSRFYPGSPCCQHFLALGRSIYRWYKPTAIPVLWSFTSPIWSSFWKNVILIIIRTSFSWQTMLRIIEVAKQWHC